MKTKKGLNTIKEKAAVNNGLTELTDAELGQVTGGVAWTGTGKGAVTKNVLYTEQIGGGIDGKFLPLKERNGQSLDIQDTD